ncbi:NDP-sugar synthase, partial [Candidatus Peregrinibacteria bacterium]|nr:NDP-sugar synthase [Candidatus Peregrinibacteria bacterium]
MKAIILAAGRSQRMQPIADKNFLEFLGKPLIAHQIKALSSAGFRDILIVGGRHNVKRLAALGLPVREQKDLDLGMAGAILSAAPWIKKEPFLVLSSNDVLEESAFALFRKSINDSYGLLLAQLVARYFPGGYLEIREDHSVKRIIEKPGEGREPSRFVNIVVHFHHKPAALFEALQTSVKNAGRGADDLYERALQELFLQKIHYRALPYSGFWQPVKYPWHVLQLMYFYLLSIEKAFPRGRSGAKKADVAKTAVIRGPNVYLDEGVKVLDHASIVGPAYIGRNTVIANNTLVRQSHIGADCVIGFGSEIARSFLGSGVWTHSNY